MVYEEIIPESEFWKPEKIDEFIEGVYVNVERNQGAFGSNIYHIDTNNGEEDIIKVWGCTVLDDRMQLINVGEKIKIVYKGTKPSNTYARDVKIFAVYKDVPEIVK